MHLISFFEGLGFMGSLCVIFISLLCVDYLKNRKPPKYPPGPFGLPFVGNILSVDAKQPHIYLNKLAEVHGNVFGLRLGLHNVVFLNGYKMIREALVVQGENFADRPYSPTIARAYSGNNRGLFFSNGLIWKKQRHFSMSTLRQFGQRKKTLELAIREECRNLQEEMEKQKGDAFDPTQLINSAASNIICQLEFGHRCDYSDERFQRMLQGVLELDRLEGTIWHKLYEAFPFVMKHLPGRHNVIFSSFKYITDFVMDELKKHKDNLADPRDYTDTFLLEITERRRDPKEGFDKNNMVPNLVDLHLAGGPPVSLTLRWALLYLIKYPHIQERVHAEIDLVIGQSRGPSVEDQPNMPYTNAVIHEVQRLGNIVPLNGPRMATKDTTLGGCIIPKGTPVMPMLTSVLYDKSEWETPEEFNPNHFLDSEGKFRKRAAFLPFSVGKRICIGEQLAHMALFFFIVSLFQKFQFSTQEGVELSLEGIVGPTRFPYPFKIYAHKRYQ